MEKRQRKKGYPTPFTIDPISPEHTHTFIVLHGRGSKGEKFGCEFLDYANLPARLPTVRFVFPTASKRRSTIFKKMPINQWFDNYSLDDPNQRTDLQVDGLMETAQFLRELIGTEAQILGGGSGQIGYQKVILGGLSQGCAAGIFTLLGGGFGESGNERLGAFIGMSGWLPFEKQLNDMTDDEEEKDEKEEDDQDDEESESDDSESSDEDEDEEDDDGSDSEARIDVSLSDAASNAVSSGIEVNFAAFDPFQSETQEDSGRDSHSNIMDVINHVRDILDLESVSISGTFSALQTPVFLGHGSADPKVSVHLGERMAELLSKKLKMDVTWKAYEGFGHWYKVPDEIDDVLDFLREKSGLPVVDVSQY
ncbi:acyl-protein thioesterase [Talaromyces pinophilus]|uniref:Acyl-protein thioesterase n=1 Tax=Talaromyces pinophilus TaxID=128442 RepID=A0A6V8H9U8_TALPI|nr:acyl-protein thioesterase [Talaromyces pinophilus]